jgi:hypothetical protein
MWEEVMTDRDLTRAEAVERATRVKPLVWEPVGPDELLSDDYCIKIDGFTLRLWHRDLLIASSQDIDGIARLQSIADKHHEQRIRAALKPAPVVTAGWPTEEGEGSIIVGNVKGDSHD